MPTTARLLRRAAGAGLVAVAAAGAAAYVGTRRRTRADEAAAELPEDVRAAIEEGLAAGGQGRAADEGIVWIPIGGHALLEDVEAVDDAPAAAPA